MKTMKKNFSIRSKLLLKILFAIIVFSSLANIGTTKEQYAYIANSGNQSVTIIDLENMTKHTLFLGFSLRYLNKIPGYDQLLIYNKGYYDSYLRIIDSNDGTLLLESSIRDIKGVAISSDGTQVFVAYESNPAKISVMRTDDFSEIRNFPIVAMNNLTDFVISNNRQIIYAIYSNNFFIINANDGNIINAVPLNNSAGGFLVSPKEDYAYVYSGYWDFDRINLTTLDVQTLATNRDVEALAISHDGRFLYAALDYSNNVNVYNTQTLNQVASFAVGSQNTAELHVSSDDSLLYVLNPTNPNFEIYECQTGRRVTAMYTGSNTYDFDFDYPPSDSIKPQPVTTVQVLNIYNDGALLSWSAASDDSLTERVRGYDVRYDTVAITDIDLAKIYPHSVKPSLPGETDSLKVTGLNAKTKYWVAIRTYDEAKNFSDSVIVELTTLDLPKISVSPGSFDYSVSIGDTIEQYLTISNVGGADAGALDYDIQVSWDKDSTIQFAYIANSTNGTVSIIDIINSTQRTINLDGYPYEIKKSPLSNDLWIADPNRDILYILDITIGKVKNIFAVNDISKIRFSADGTRAYVLYGNYNSWIKVYHTIQMREILSFSISSNYRVYDFCLSHDGKYLYTTAGGYFYTYSALTGNRISSQNINLSSRMIEISPDDSYAYLCGDSYLLKLDLQNFTFKENSIGSNASALAISPDGHQLFVGFNYTSAVIIYNTASLSQFSSISLNNDRITDIKVSPDMNYLFVLHEDSPNLGIYDLKTRSQLESFSTGYDSYRFDISMATLPYIKVNPLSGTIQGGKADTVTFIIYSEYLLHKIYKTNIVIRSNDIDNPAFKVPITINSQDTKPPEFNMAFFINPYLSNNLKVMVFAHEFLPESPQLFIGESDELSLALHDSSYYIYMAKYKLTTSEDITFTVTGSDSLGNSSTFQRTLRVTNVPLGKATVFSNREGELTVKIASESFDQDRFILLWEENEEEALNKVYHLGPDFVSLKNSATIEIDYSANYRSVTEPHHLSIYQKSISDQWQKIPSRIDKGRKVVLADISQLGVFKVGYDESNASEEFISITFEYGLQQNYPNPFNPNTTICYAIPTQQHVTLKVYNVLGREVATLIDKLQEAGNYKIIFSSENFVSGIYFYRLEAGEYNETRKMILLR